MSTVDLKQIALCLPGVSKTDGQHSDIYHVLMLAVNVQDEYHALSYKTMALWKMAEEQFDVHFLIKVDDDNYVRLDRLALALAQWQTLEAGVSCTRGRAVHVLYETS